MAITMPKKEISEGETMAGKATIVPLPDRINAESRLLFHYFVEVIVKSPSKLTSKSAILYMELSGMAKIA